jgi:pilus assembly protein CpaF
VTVLPEYPMAATGQQQGLPPARVDYALVRLLRVAVGEDLQAMRGAAAKDGRPLAAADELQVAWELIADKLRQHTQALLDAGRPAPPPEADVQVIRAVHAALFGSGRLQPLLEDASIENVDINGCDEVFLGYADGRTEPGPPVADDDEELIELVRTLGAYAGLNARPFDPANPQLDVRLPDGSRLSAVMSATERPAVSIRRNRFPRVFLADLAGNGTVSPQLATFLRAAVLARKNIMVAGATNAGKTTLLRALINEVPPVERLITVERSLELGLRAAGRDLHPNVVEMEEVAPNTEGAGGVSMAELVRRTLRMNPSRVIVGEVLGPEVVTMLNAMSQGSDGSLSTIHARTARDVFHRIATYALQAEEHMSPETAQHLISGALDFVVFIVQSRRGRYVSEVLEVTGYDAQVLASAVFVPAHPGGPAVPNDATRLREDREQELAAHGYHHLADPANGWAGLLPEAVRR